MYILLKKFFNKYNTKKKNKRKLFYSKYKIEYLKKYLGILLLT